MIAGKKWWIPSVLIAFGFLTELLSGKLAIFTTQGALWIYRTGISIAGFFILLELISVGRKFIENLKQKETTEVKKNGNKL